MIFLGLISSQIIKIPQPVLGIPGRRSKALYELVFPVDTLPGLAISNFQITRNTTEEVHLLKLKSQLKAIKKGGELFRPSKHSDNSREDFMIKNSNVSLPTVSMFFSVICILIHENIQVFINFYVFSQMNKKRNTYLQIILGTRVTIVCSNSDL